MIDLDHYLKLAIGAVKEAGLSIRPDMDQKVVTDLSRDVKIVGDKRLSTMIKNFLESNSPYSVLSEEEDFSTDVFKKGEYLWIIDPIDGSLNFSRMIPFSCISIALWKGKEPILGVIYDFNHQELFSGIVGQGAWLNGKAITVSNIKEKKDAVLCTGFPVATDFSSTAIEEFAKNIREFKKVRLFGSAALSLAYVASARADAYLEKDIKIWDVAAGMALVKASGGFIEPIFSDSSIKLRLMASSFVV